MRAVRGERSKSERRSKAVGGRREGVSCMGMRGGVCVHGQWQREARRVGRDASRSDAWRDICECSKRSALESERVVCERV